MARTIIFALATIKYAETGSQSLSSFLPKIPDDLNDSIIFKLDTFFS